MGVTKYAMTTYGYQVPWALIETRTETEVASCGHTDTLQEIMFEGKRDLPFCPVCGARVGTRSKFEYAYTDIVEEVPEDDIDGYYVTCKGYPVWKKEYHDEEDLAYIGYTIGEDSSMDVPEDDVYDMLRVLTPIFGKEGFGIHCWVAYK